MKRRWMFLWCLMCFCLSFLVKFDASARISPEDEQTLNKRAECTREEASMCNKCLSVVGGAYSEIKSVVEACYDKYLGGGTLQSPDYNYCAMWIGPTDNSAGTEVIIDVKAEDVDSGKEIGDVEIGFWGMCVPGGEGKKNLKAANIKVENDNGSIERPKIDGEPCVYRNPWPWGENQRPALTTTTLNIRKFISGNGVTCRDNKGGAICRGEESGERIYERSITVKRRFGGSSCNTSNTERGETIPFSIRLNADSNNTVYYSMSNVAAARRDDTEYVTTGITDKTTTVTAEKTDVYVGDVVNLIFSHNVFSDREKNGVSWRMVRDTPLENCGNEGSYVFLECNKGKNKDSTDFDIEYNDVRYGLGRIYVPERTYSDGTYKFITRDTYKLKFTKPGTYTFCETMKVPGETEMTTACAKYVVKAGVCDEWIPESYYRGVTSVEAKVSKYNSRDYKNVIYVKPKDKVEWLHCYYPGVQTEYKNVSSVSGWGNSFTVTTTNLRNVMAQGDAEQVGNYRSGTTALNRYNGGGYLIGDSDIRNLYDRGSRDNSAWDGFTVAATDVGKELIETNTSSSPIEVGYDLSINASDSAKAIVPYNFKNTISVKLKSDGIYAGETAVVDSVEVQVRTRKNNETGGTYATIVRKGKIKFAGYLSDTDETGGSDGVSDSDDLCASDRLRGKSDCESQKKLFKEEDFNSNNVLKLGSSEGTVAKKEVYSGGVSLDVPDEMAGSYYCVVAAVYPASSGSDKQMGVNGDGKWYISSPSCVKIAKKPSLQIWGGGLYSNGKVSTSVAKKRDLKGVDLKGKVAVFGSWAETSIVSNGMINGLASGAATGYPNSSDEAGGSLEDPESDSTAFCDIRSPMTIPSSACGSGSISDIMNSGGLPFGNTGGVEKSELEKRIAEILAKLENIDSSVVNLEKTDGDYTISENVTISDGGYSNVAEIPKNVFVAKNIYINCNVTRIDAILIAEGVVKTCADVDDSDVDNESRLTQLKINGMIIADSFVPGRTYGASTGRYSTIPAEIINYDSSIYFLGLFNSNGGSGSSSKDLETVYIQELPPRL